ncbi:hypothetical protein [Azospirillum sp. TSO22-1]|uniref:hypothetical protein n=1 Tax=Azospirillum sp. TSO22-1 TaxID=716789 RepID=UPI000D622994|nr:hypothetical protein [Azospirillum sp. TSO22-1]PWC52418.1 hypothetical protein TSO221_14405 [Azospirillum sp. TSO22-1]
MQPRILWPVIGCIAVLLAAVWAFGGGMSPVGGMGLALGIVGTLVVGVGLMAIILYGRRSRRDRMVDRGVRRDV